jgi:hypothetical protein
MRYLGEDPHHWDKINHVVCVTKEKFMAAK